MQAPSGLAAAFLFVRRLPAANIRPHENHSRQNGRRHGSRFGTGPGHRAPSGRGRWDLHLVDIDLPAVEAVADECRDRGVRAVAARCDVSQLADLEAAARMLAEWGTVDILINNAGIAWYGHTLKMPADAWERLLDVNLHAPIHLTRLLLPRMLSGPRPTS